MYDNIHFVFGIRLTFEQFVMLCHEEFINSLQEIYYNESHFDRLFDPQIEKYGTIDDIDLIKEIDWFIEVDSETDVTGTISHVGDLVVFRHELSLEEDCYIFGKEVSTVSGGYSEPLSFPPYDFFENLGRETMLVSELNDFFKSRNFEYEAKQLRVYVVLKEA